MRKGRSRSAVVLAGLVARFTYAFGAAELAPAR